MSDEEKKDILFQIDMQLYDEFNDKFCKMNDNLGTFYTYKDIEDLEKFKKETEIKLLREAIEKQQKEIAELKYKVREHICIEAHEQVKQLYISKNKIKAKIEEVQNMKAKAKDIVFKSSLNYIETELQSLLEKE